MITTITGKDKTVEVIRRWELVERLPDIATQAELAPGFFETRFVALDDLDRAVTIMLEAIADLRQRFPDAPLVADYTGGTKTRSAALVLVTIGEPVAYSGVGGQARTTEGLNGLWDDDVGPSAPGRRLRSPPARPLELTE